MAKMKKKWLWIGAALALAILIAVVIGVSAGGEAPVEEAPADIAIETPVCTLYYPAQWQEQVSWEIREEGAVTVSFFGQISKQARLALFDVIFDDVEEGSLGAFEAAGRIWQVHLKIYDADPALVDTAEKRYLFNALQEALNDLMAKLPIGISGPEESVLLVPAQTEPAEDILVQTPYALLSCPGVPGKTITAHTAEGKLYTVTYVWEREGAGSVRLFEIGFGGEDVYAMGFLEDSGIPVRLTIFPVEKEQDLPPAELDTALELQELVNSVLEGLPLMQRQSTAPGPGQPDPVEGEPAQPEQAEPTQPSAEETQPETTAPESAETIPLPADFAAQTPYGVLCFPVEHQENLKTEVIGERECTVRFLYLRDNGECCPLFDVIFRGTGDFQVGTLLTADGTSVAVGMVSHDAAVDASWSGDDETKFYAMAEGANYVFDRLAELYDFTFLN